MYGTKYYVQFFHAAARAEESLNTAQSHTATRRTHPALPDGSHSRNVPTLLVDSTERTAPLPLTTRKSKTRHTGQRRHYHHYYYYYYPRYLFPLPHPTAR